MTLTLRININGKKGDQISTTAYGSKLALMTPGSEHVVNKSKLFLVVLFSSTLKLGMALNSCVGIECTDVSTLIHYTTYLTTI